MVIAQPPTHTLYYSTIGSALIITYRKLYRSTVDTIAILPTTHKGVGVRAEAIQSTDTVSS